MNRPNDLLALFSFLEVEPLNDKPLFDEKVVAPIADFKEIGLARLRTMVSHLSLRRTKDVLNGVIELPPKEVVVRLCEFDDDDDDYHRNIHDTMYKVTRAVYASLVGAIGQKGIVPQGTVSITRSYRQHFRRFRKSLLTPLRLK